MDEKTKAEVEQIIEMVSIYQTTLIGETDPENIVLIKKDLTEKQKKLGAIKAQLNVELMKLYDNGANEIDPEINQLRNQIQEMENALESIGDMLGTTILTDEKLEEEIDELEEEADSVNPITEPNDELQQALDVLEIGNFPQGEESVGEPIKDLADEGEKIDYLDEKPEQDNNFDAPEEEKIEELAQPIEDFVEKVKKPEISQELEAVGEADDSFEQPKTEEVTEVLDERPVDDEPKMEEMVRIGDIEIPKKRFEEAGLTVELKAPSAKYRNIGSKIVAGRQDQDIDEAVNESSRAKKLVSEKCREALLGSEKQQSSMEKKKERDVEREEKTR